MPLAGESGAAQASLPVEEPAVAAEAPENGSPDPRARAAELIGALQEFPEALQDVHTWAEGRKIDLSNITDTQLRGAVRKLETTLEKAKAEPRL